MAWRIFSFARNSDAARRDDGDRPTDRATRADAAKFKFKNWGAPAAKFRILNFAGKSDAMRRDDGDRPTDQLEPTPQNPKFKIWALPRPNFEFCREPATQRPSDPATVSKF